ncbi:MAG TPA: LuxR C-terminal-related transcriptional regulator, partial [Anaerolineae bacterium]|nr:LuxR C-terminal-related transcriptional regulator [Anaerolineae bacterium]
LVQLPEDEVFLRGIATYTLGVAHLLGGDVEAATQALEEAAKASELAGNVMVAVMALCALAELYAALAQLRRAEEAYRRALDLATGEYGRDLPISGMALIGLGELNREWNNLEAATGYLVEGIERAKAWTELGASDGCLALARVKQAQGDDGGAQEMMRQAQELAARAGISHFSDAILEAYQAWLWICQGNLAAAERWTAGKGLAPSLLEGVRVEAGEPWDDLLDIKEGGLSVDYHLRKYEHLVWARLLLAQNRPGQALAVVDPFLAAMDQVGGRGSAKAIELLILRALSLQGLGDIANALETLAGALSLAEPGGYVRLFLDEGEPMARLLRTAADRNIEPKYVERLLSAHESGSSAQAPISIPSPEPIVRRPSSVGQRPSLPLVEPLTEREQEVLGLLATHLNSTEIAGQLCISPHTVRYHIKSIYGKLGVHRRTEAVERARDLDLL